MVGSTSFVYPQEVTHVEWCELLQCRSSRVLFHIGNLRLAAEIVSAGECANSLNVLSKQLELCDKWQAA